MSVDPVAVALIETCVFLSTCDDSIINADAAVTQLEHIASHLKCLDDERKLQFVATIEQLAKQESLGGGVSSRVEGLRSLGDSLGIA